jgi:hypothetical protein
LLHMSAVATNVRLYLQLHVTVRVHGALQYYGSQVIF